MSEGPETDRRHWLQFRLSDLLLLVAIVGVAAATHRASWPHLTRGSIYLGSFLAIVSLATARAVSRDLMSRGPWLACALFGWSYAYFLIQTPQMTQILAFGHDPEATVMRLQLQFALGMAILTGLIARLWFSLVERR